jgi:hypothetical protein
VGRGSSPSSPSSCSSLSSPEDSDSEGVSSPCALAAVRAALLSHLLCFRACCLLLSTRLASRLAISLGKVTPPRVVAHAPETLHKSACTLKKQNLTQSDKKKLERTYPGADGPSLKGIRLGPEFRLGS